MAKEDMHDIKEAKPGKNLCLSVRLPVAAHAGRPRFQTPNGQPVEFVQN